MDQFDSQGLITNPMLSPTNDELFPFEVNGDQLTDLLSFESPQPQTSINDPPADTEPPQLEPVLSTENAAVSPQMVPRPVLARKRKFEEMEEENKYNDEDPSVGDIIVDDPLSPKRMKLDPDSSTLSRLSQVQLFSDIIFNVRGIRFYGNKAFFAIKSAVLQSMMYPSDGTNITELIIDDISAKAFRFIKDYVYDENPSLDSDNIIDVLTASKMYKMTQIEQQCNTFLNDIDNVSDLLNILKPFGENGIEMEAELENILKNNVNLLQENGADIIGSEIFKSLPFNIAKRIMQSDDLGVNEEELFNVAMTWNNYGEELKGIIRFGIMNIEFLYNTVKQTGILGDADLVQLYEKELGMVKECQFNSKPRHVAKKKRTRGGSRKKSNNKATTPTKKTSTRKKRGRKAKK